jgi:hypothetical protein
MERKDKISLWLYRLVVCYSILVASYCVGISIVAHADCPACFNNETPAAATTDPNGGPPYYSIFQDSSTNPFGGTYQVALNLAMGQWNNALSGGGVQLSFRNAPPQVADANGNYPPMPQVSISIANSLGTNKSGEKVCGTLTTSKVNTTPNGPATTIVSYAITLPLEAQNWSISRIAEVIKHELGHLMGLDDVNQGCDSVMQQSNSDCTQSVHGTIESRDVESALKYATDRGNCTKPRPNANHDDTTGGGGPGGYCGSDPCCYDPECCGDPNCGDQWCSIVCDYECSRYGDEFDPETDEVTHWSDWECGSTNCQQECY